MTSLAEQIECAKLMLQAERDWKYVDRQFPAYSLAQDLQGIMEATFSLEDMQELLLQLPQETLWGVYDMYTEYLLERFKSHLTPAWAMSTIICDYVARQVAPEWNLPPITTWNEWKERKEKGWL